MADPEETAVRRETDKGSSDPRRAEKPSGSTLPRIWVQHCPFRKDGTPVLGTFGASDKAVVIMTLETWKKLCADVPALQTTQFEVGTHE